MSQLAKNTSGDIEKGQHVKQQLVIENSNNHKKKWDIKNIRLIH